MRSSLNAFVIFDPAIIVIVCLTAFTSIYAFYHQRLYFLFILHPYSIVRRKKLYTLLTAAFVHTGWFHLIFNLVIIYVLGSVVERQFIRMDETGTLKFVVLYFSSILIGNYGSTWFHRRDFSYRSAGASTGALAILGSFCVLYAKESHLEIPFIGELSNISFILIFIVGLIYELRNWKNDHIDHYAHLFGVLSGMIITVSFYPELLIELCL